MAVLERRKSVKGLAAFSIRVAPELKKKLEDTAYDRRISMGRLAEELIEKGLEQYEK